MTAPDTYIVRYGQMRFLGEFQGLTGEVHPRGQAVVVRTERGEELGEVLCPATARTSALPDNPSRGQVVRVVAPEDEAARAALAGLQRRAYDACRERIAARGLPMDLVDVEAILGGERLVFYFLAADRVDFRELVKDLARAFHTRIEMRQIGVRDEAKLLADYGDCGKPVCCNTHLAHMPPVSMRMAKLQKTTLDPSRISGRCGRLKCCLRYEFDVYEGLERELPPLHARVTTSRGPGRVLAREVLARRIVVELADRRRLAIGPEEILAVEPPAAPGRRRGDVTTPAPEPFDPIDDEPSG